MDGRRIGLRWSRPGLDAELRSLTGAALGTGNAPPNLSVVLGAQSGRARTKHELHVQGRLVCVTSREGALVRAVVRAIGVLATAVPDGALSIDAFLLVSADGNATAVDRRLANDFRRVEPRLRRAGLRVVEVPWLVVRPAEATVLLPDGVGALGLSVARLDQRWPRKGTDDPLTAGEVVVTGLVYMGAPEPESLAAAVGDMVPLVRDASNRVRAADVEGLARFAGAVEHEAVPSGAAAGLLELLLG